MVTPAPNKPRRKIDAIDAIDATYQALRQVVVPVVLGFVELCGSSGFSASNSMLCGPRGALPYCSDLFGATLPYMGPK